MVGVNQLVPALTAQFRFNDPSLKIRESRDLPDLSYQQTLIPVKERDDQIQLVPLKTFKYHAYPFLNDHFETINTNKPIAKKDSHSHIRPAGYSKR